MATDLVAPTFDDALLDSEPSATAIDSDQAVVNKDEWVTLCQDFLRCHRRPLNVALHLVTTPLSLFGFLVLVNLLHPGATIGLVLAYVALVALYVPRVTWLATTLFSVALAGAVLLLSPTWVVGTITLVVGYVGQEVAHWITGEQTLQSTYIRERSWLSRLVQHTVLLIPVLIVIAARRKQSPLRILVARKAVLPTRLSASSSQQDLRSIRDWVHVKEPDVQQSIHWWQSDLDGEAGEAFERLSRDPKIMSLIRRFHGTGYEVQPVLGMNELYVTGPPKKSTSDTVFYMGHVDGPWAVFPGARLYRCMLAASTNKEVTTHFPMCGTEYRLPEGHRLETGDAVAFDFNRELHYITREPSEEQTEPRINLKLHFVAYPKAVRWYGSLLSKLTTDYDIRARRLFLNTIDPNSLWQTVKTKWVLGWTKIFELTVKHVGWTNLAYITVMALVSLIAGDLRCFLVATSFVHYGIYFGTYRETTPVAYGVFRRNAVFFKAIAMTCLAALYCASVLGSDIGLATYASLTLVLAGFGLATYATKILGMNRTYFSAELGFDEPQQIKRFPYGVIPHPMILGAVIGIAAMLLVPQMRAEYWWLIAGHIGCYAVILYQEISKLQSVDPLSLGDPKTT